MTIALPADLSALALLAEHVAAFGAREGLTDACILELQLALVELVTNVVEHGRPARGPTVHLARDGAVLRAVVEDAGPAFDPDRAPEPDPSSPTGRGLLLVRSVTSELAWRRDGDRNVVTLTKRL